jgi:hypothetical protein
MLCGWLQGGAIEGSVRSLRSVPSHGVEHDKELPQARDHADRPRFLRKLQTLVASAISVSSPKPRSGRAQTQA